MEGGSDEDGCAAAILGYLAEHGHDLDAHLSSAERSELAAFRRGITRHAAGAALSFSRGGPVAGPPLPGSALFPHWHY